MFAAITGRESLTPLKVVALCVAFAGLVMALGPNLETLDIRGIACSAAGGTAMALTITFSGPVLQRH